MTLLILNRTTGRYAPDATVYAPPPSEAVNRELNYMAKPSVRACFKVSSMHLASTLYYVSLVPRLSPRSDESLGTRLILCREVVMTVNISVQERDSTNLVSGGGV